MRIMTAWQGRHRKRVRPLVGVCVVALVLLLPASAYAWTKYQYFSGLSQYPYNFGVETSGSVDRQYNNAYHTTIDEWHVRYRAGSSIIAQSYSYASPTSLGPSGQSAYSACESIVPNSTGVAFSCATTVP